jgi:hypothetical protein
MAVSHPEISLYTLNAPRDSINDVTPLSMAAWLDMPQVITILLADSSGAVSVDAEDTDGATPLMCKSRPTVRINLQIDLIGFDRCSTRWQAGSRAAPRTSFLARADSKRLTVIR